MTKYLVVMLGGAVGAVARFTIATLVLRFYFTIFPLGTFLINITGSFLIGICMTFFLNRPMINANWRLFLVTGILGGYTTFSSFEWEALATWRSGAEWIALIYLAGSVIVGLGSAWLGLMAANRLWPY